MTERHAETFGVYVHVPFCAHRCDYCAFATYADRDHLMEEYVTSVLQEIAWARDEDCRSRRPCSSAAARRRDSSAEQLLRILDAIPTTDDAEVTVECNPEDASLERLRAYRAGGVNRMSFGVQSTQPAVLADLGRRHGTMAHEEVSRAVTAAGFATWNMDLIIGSRAESLDDVAHTLDDLLGLDDPPPHISCYVLTPEPGTPLGEDPLRHPDEDESADAYDLVSRVLEATRLPVGGDLELGQARTRVPPQPRLLGPGRLRRFRIGRALASPRTAFLERAHARSLHRDGARRPATARGRGEPRRTNADASNATRWRCARAKGVPRRSVRLAGRDRAPRQRARRPRDARAEGPTAREPGDPSAGERGLAR